MKFVYFARELEWPRLIAAGTAMWLEDEDCALLRESDPAADALLNITPLQLYVAVTRALWGVQPLARSSAAGLYPCPQCTRPDALGRPMVANPMLGCEACRGERRLVDIVASPAAIETAREAYARSIADALRSALGARGARTGEGSSSRQSGPQALLQPPAQAESGGSLKSAP